jgi:hypothetical protein
VDGKILPAFTVLSEFSGRLFDVVNVCLDNPRREAWAGSVACQCLERELGESKSTLLKESDDHDTLRLAIGLVLEDLGMTSEPRTRLIMT